LVTKLNEVDLCYGLLIRDFWQCMNLAPCVLPSSQVSVCLASGNLNTCIATLYLHVKEGQEDFLFFSIFNVTLLFINIECTRPVIAVVVVTSAVGVVVTSAVGVVWSAL